MTDYEMDCVKAESKAEREAAQKTKEIAEAAIGMILAESVSNQVFDAEPFDRDAMYITFKAVRDCREQLEKAVRAFLEQQEE